MGFRGWFVVNCVFGHGYMCVCEIGVDRVGNEQEKVLAGRCKAHVSMLCDRIRS